LPSRTVTLGAALAELQLCQVCFVNVPYTEMSHRVKRLGPGVISITL
jgi:hypothetical protein